MAIRWQTHPGLAADGLEERQSSPEGFCQNSVLDT